LKTIISPIIKSLKENEPVVLCSILKSTGSSPRGAGAKMAVFNNGHFSGTIGGGAVEHLALKEALKLFSSKTGFRKTYNMQGGEMNNTNMICGGSVTVNFQLITPSDLLFFERLQTTLSDNINSWMIMNFKDHIVTNMAIYTQKDLPENIKPFATTHTIFNENLYIEPITRKGRVYIFGGGHVGAALVPVLAAVDFNVTVFDNRAERAQAAFFPQADAVIFGDYANFEEKITLAPEDYVVVMTPGHQADFEVLVQALKVNTTYIGCIGSRTKIKTTHEKLRARGFSDHEIALLHAPIGLPILAETPAEIAISVAAELIRHRKETT